jgi:hypothetical protein
MNSKTLHLDADRYEQVTLAGTRPWRPRLRHGFESGSSQPLGQNVMLSWVPPVQSWKLLWFDLP